MDLMLKTNYVGIGQYTDNAKDETKDSYKKSGKEFLDTFELE